MKYWTRSMKIWGTIFALFTIFSCAVSATSLWMFFLMVGFIFSCFWAAYESRRKQVLRQQEVPRK